MIKLGMKHIRVLYKNEGSEWSNFSKLKNSIAQKWSELVNDAWALMFIESKLIQANWKAEVDKIVAEQKWELTAMQIQTIYTLYEFGEVGINMVWNNTVRGWKKFFALKEVLRKSTSEPHIMTFSNGAYTVTSISEYKSQIAAAPESINTWVVKWFVNLHKKWSSLWFPLSTWENIATYCANRKWVTNIIWWNKEIATFLWTKYGGKIKKEEWIYDGILKEFVGKMDEGTLKKLLTENKLEKTADGKIDIGKIIMGLEISNVEDIPKKLAEKSEKLKEDGMKLLKIAREEQKSLVNIKDLESLWISNLIGTIKNKSFASFMPEECIKYIPIVDELFKKEGNPKRKEEIKKIQGILIAVKGGYENVKNGWALILHTKEASKLIKQNPNSKTEDIIRNAESSEIRKKESLAEDVSVTRAGIEQWKNILQDMNIDISSFEDLQKKYNELVEKEKNIWLTKEEERIKAQLYSQIQANIRAAQVVKNYEWFLTKEDIKEVFIDTNRFISDNPNEIYNFQAIEKIAVLTDPESSIWARNLARLEPGQSMSMDRFVEWDLRSPLSSAPEISNISVSMNQQGTYDIPTLWAVNLSKEQVQEYMTNVSLYADMWLSQLIPHLTMITGELRNKWVNTAIDGSSNTMEQQQVLKALYSQLFGKEIISSSLGDVERAYSSALGNPTSMKNAMQGVLKTHRLIGESGWSIAADTLQKWIRQNKIENQKPTINLT